jgi:hypothetical protein
MIHYKSQFGLEIVNPNMFVTFISAESKERDSYMRRRIIVSNMIQAKRSLNKIIFAVLIILTLGIGFLSAVLLTHLFCVITRDDSASILGLPIGVVFGGGIIITFDWLEDRLINNVSVTHRGKKYKQ